MSTRMASNRCEGWSGLNPSTEAASTAQPKKPTLEQRIFAAQIHTIYESMRFVLAASVAATGINVTLDFPPPGAGFTTYTDPRPTAATNASGTEAVSCWALTNVVGSDVPFQKTKEPPPNPVPLTVSVTLVDPGLMLTGETIWTNGTGLLGIAETRGARSAQNATIATAK